MLNPNNLHMPQLVPFYFFNELTYTFVIIATTVYILSKYILPRFVRLFLSRTFISKLLHTSEKKI
jgi:F-type H+-transporting ATPase subunit 8